MAPRKKKTKVLIPGGLKCWTKALPGVYATDPFVVVAMLPEESEVYVAEQKNGTQLGIAKYRGITTGLQVMGDQKLNMWIEHEAVFADYGVEMARPFHIGRISTIPDGLLMHSDLTPIVFFRDAMWRPFWSLRAYLRSEDTEKTQ